MPNCLRHREGQRAMWLTYMPCLYDESGYIFLCGAEEANFVDDIRNVFIDYAGKATIMFLLRIKQNQFHINNNDNNNTRF